MTDETPLMIANGRNGRVELYRDRVRLKRDGALSLLSAIAGITNAFVDKTIPLKQISSIDVVQPLTKVGFIRFSYPGAPTSTGKYNIDFYAENVISLNGLLSNAPFHEIKKKIEELQLELSASQSVPANISKEIERLSDLHERGILTNEEFTRAKNKIIGG